MRASGNRALEQETDDAVAGTSGAIYGPKGLIDLLNRNHATARPNTQRTYATYERQFRVWLLEKNGINLAELEEAGDTTRLPSGHEFAKLAAAFIKYQYDEKASDSVIKACRSCLSRLYTKLNLVCGLEGQPVLRDVPVFNLEFDTAMGALKGKGVRPKGVDPQANTAAEPLTREEFEHLATFTRRPDTHMTLKWKAEKLARYRALMLLLYFGLGRSDDSRLMYISDLCSPMHLVGLGPCIAYAFHIVLRGGKAQKNGQSAYITYIRAKDVMLCPVGGMSESMWRRHTAHRIPFPDPTNEKQWAACPLFPSETDASVESQYSQQHKDLRHLFKHANINSNKVCHAFRPAAATHMDQAGVADADILRTGRWASGALYNHYLTKAPPSALLVLAGYEPEVHGMKQAFWAERFNAPIGDEALEECKLWLYPWLVDLRRQVATIKQAGKSVYPTSIISGPSVLDAVEMLARVAVEDALELADRMPDNAMVQHFHQLPAWCALRQAYVHAKANNELEATRPIGTTDALAVIAEQLAEISQQQQQHFAAAGGAGPWAAAAAANAVAGQPPPLSAFGAPSQLHMWGGTPQQAPPPIAAAAAAAAAANAVAGQPPPFSALGAPSQLHMSGGTPQQAPPPIAAAAAAAAAANAVAGQPPPFSALGAPSQLHMSGGTPQQAPLPIAAAAAAAAAANAVAGQPPPFSAFGAPSQLRLQSGLQQQAPPPMLQPGGPPQQLQSGAAVQRSALLRHAKTVSRRPPVVGAQQSSGGYMAQPVAHPPLNGIPELSHVAAGEFPWDETLTTLAEVIEEWEEGRVENGIRRTALKLLEERHGNKWRKLPKHMNGKQRWRDRKILILGVRTTAEARGVSMQEAAQYWMKRQLENEWSLDALRQYFVQLVKSKTFEQHVDPDRPDTFQSPARKRRRKHQPAASPGGSVGGAGAGTFPAAGAAAAAATGGTPAAAAAPARGLLSPGTAAAAAAALGLAGFGGGTSGMAGAVGAAPGGAALLRQVLCGSNSQLAAIPVTGPDGRQHFALIALPQSVPLPAAASVGQASPSGGAVGVADAVKRPINAFQDFCQEMRAVPGQGGLRLDQLGRMWDDLTSEQKAPYYKAYDERLRVYEDAKLKAKGGKACGKKQKVK